MSARPYDVVVVGAGTAGTAAADHLARRGLRVALLEQRDPRAAGAHWVNGVPPWMFAAADIADPVSPERRPIGGAFLVHGVGGACHLAMDPAPVWPVDMRLLVARLQADALARGVELVAPARVVDVELDATGRPRAVVALVGGARRTLRAALFVDASGMNGVLRACVPRLAADCPPVPREHICSAAQAVHSVADPVGAQAALERARARVGDVICTVGLDGGFSTANFSVDADGDVDLLAGAIATPGRRSGPAILAAMRARHPWIGERQFGGAGAIPLRRPYDRLGAPGVALVGNAACQVFSAHGSGIGVGLIAARVLASSVARESDPGSARAVWSYQAAFHREWGGVMAAYDLFRRSSQGFTGAEVDALMTAGVVVPQLSRAAMEQKLVVPDLESVTRIGLGAARTPRLALRFGASMARIPVLLGLYARHPLDPNAKALRLWSRAVARVLGEPADLGKGSHR